MARALEHCTARLDSFEREQTDLQQQLAILRYGARATISVGDIVLRGNSDGKN
jgi:hypothetical protein